MQSCAYINCFSCSKDKLKFFAFPNDNRRSVWLKNSGNIDCNSRSRLCEKHFSPDDIFPTQLKSVLRKSAIPFNYKDCEHKYVVKYERADEDEPKTQSDNFHDCVVKCEREDEDQNENGYDVENTHVVYLLEAPPEPTEIKYNQALQKTSNDNFKPNQLHCSGARDESTQPCIRAIQSDYRRMFLKPDFGDTSIAVDGKTLRVHKDILSERCPVFAEIFSQLQSTQIVTIRDFDFKTILAMIEFIYYNGGDDFYAEDAVDPVELLKAAHKYQLYHLKNKCVQRLCTIMNKNNIDSYMELADTYGLPILKNEAYAFKTNN